MKTLYDLLGARPNDDAASIRTAFCQAVKETHPDVSADNADGSERFRQIVRANAILSDVEQRAVYDRLLAAALHPVRTFATDTIRKLASDTIAVVILSAVLAGAYVLLWPTFRTAVVAAGGTEVAVRHVDATAAPVAGTQAMVGGASSTRAANDAASSYRNRGISAYRVGDLALALADFDIAIQHDPNFADAYLDRGIVFYRMRNFERAFADVAQARRIDRLAMTRTPR